MTLILSLATPEFLVQVADRRLSLMYPNGRFVVNKEEVVKQTLFCNRMIFAYTGLANIGSLKTDVRLAHKLGELPTESVDEAITHLRDRATEAFRSIYHPPRIKIHAFVGLGWTRLSDDGPFLPTMCRISNFHDEDGKLLSQARDEFTTGYRVYEPPKYFDWLDPGV